MQVRKSWLGRGAFPFGRARWAHRCLTKHWQIPPGPGRHSGLAFGGGQTRGRLGRAAWKRRRIRNVESQNPRQRRHPRVALAVSEPVSCVSISSATRPRHLVAAPCGMAFQDRQEGDGCGMRNAGTERGYQATSVARSAVGRGPAPGRAPRLHANFLNPWRCGDEAGHVQDDDGNGSRPPWAWPPPRPGCALLSLGVGPGRWWWDSMKSSSALCRRLRLRPRLLVPVQVNTTRRALSSRCKRFVCVLSLCASAPISHSLRQPATPWPVTHFFVYSYPIHFVLLIPTPP